MTAFNVSKFKQLSRHWNLHYYPTLDSTNAEAKRQLKDKKLSSGELILADLQTAGVGRRGSDWLCNNGEGLLFTAIIETEYAAKETGKIALAAALAVADLCQFYEIKPQLKWPNDVYLNNKKVCGILIEQSGAFSLIGIGINTHLNINQESNLKATSLHLHTKEKLKREEILAHLLNFLHRRISCCGQFKTLLKDWQRWDFLSGCSISLQQDKKHLSGNYHGINANGNLLLEHQGSVLPIHQAENLQKINAT